MNVIVATPGRLLQHLGEGLDVANLKMLVLDEADQCLSEEFSPQVRKH